MDDFLGWIWNANAYVAVLVFGIAGVLLLFVLFRALGFGRDLGSTFGSEFTKGLREKRDSSD